MVSKHVGRPTSCLIDGWTRARSRDLSSPRHRPEKQLWECWVSVNLIIYECGLDLCYTLNVLNDLFIIGCRNNLCSKLIMTVLTGNAGVFI